MIGVAKNPNELPGSAIDMKLASYRRSITFGTSVSCASDAVPNRRHSVQRTPLPLPALRRNWFSQLYFHFHFSHQSSIGLSTNIIKYTANVRDNFRNLTSSFPIYNLLISQISRKFTHKFLSYYANKQTDRHTDRQTAIKTVLR